MLKFECVRNSLSVPASHVVGWVKRLIWASHFRGLGYLVVALPPTSGSNEMSLREGSG